MRVSENRCEIELRIGAEAGSPVLYGAGDVSLVVDGEKFTLTSEGSFFPLESLQRLLLRIPPETKAAIHAWLKESDG